MSNFSDWRSSSTETATPTCFFVHLMGDEDVINYDDDDEDDKEDNEDDDDGRDEDDTTINCW